MLIANPALQSIESHHPQPTFRISFDSVRLRYLPPLERLKVLQTLELYETLRIDPGWWCLCDNGILDKRMCPASYSQHEKRNLRNY